jgi:methyl-accepting chemotaxis protein
MRIGGRQLKFSILLKMMTVSFVVLVAFACWYCYWALPRFQADKIRDAETRTRNAVELACGAINYVHQMEQSGLLTTDQAQAYALVAVGGLQWDTGDGEGSFWVNDSRPVLLMDAKNPGMVNTNVANVTDENGNFIYRDFMAIAQNEGGGAYTYRSANSSGHVVTNMSYVKSFEPWGWTVGTNGADRGTLIAQYRSWRDVMEIGRAHV